MVNFITPVLNFCLQYAIALNVLFLIGFTAYSAAKNATMDCITPIDILTSLGYEFSRLAMEASKDINHDGKISFMESSRPIDQWHKCKRKMNGAIALAHISCFNLGVLCYRYIENIVYFILFAIAIYLVRRVVYSVTFELFRNHLIKLYAAIPKVDYSNYTVK